jgi:Flp pilus assembly protein TadD
MWHDALSLYSATVQVSPRCARAWFNYGVALEAVGQRDAAVTAYGRALELLPTWQAESALGKVLDELGQGRAAEPHLHRAVAAAPREPDAVHNLALFYARHGARAQAAALLRPLVAAHPESSANVLLLRQLEADLARTPPR